VDALRFDYVVHDPLAFGENGTFYLNQMPKLHEIIRYEQENSFLFRFVSDAPTTTAQRLKGLWTGMKKIKENMILSNLIFQEAYPPSWT
jgi:GPI ethanolamine phosphate transferase 3 subunit O